MSMQFDVDIQWVAERVRALLPARPADLVRQTGLTHSRVAECLTWLEGNGMARWVDGDDGGRWETR